MEEDDAGGENGTSSFDVCWTTASHPRFTGEKMEIHECSRESTTCIKNESNVQSTQSERKKR